MLAKYKDSIDKCLSGVSNYKQDRNLSRKEGSNNEWLHIKYKLALAEQHSYKRFPSKINQSADIRLCIIAHGRGYPLLVKSTFGSWGNKNER